VAPNEIHSMRKFLPIVLVIIAACVVFFLWNSGGDLDGLGGEAWTLVEDNGKKIPPGAVKIVFNKGTATWQFGGPEGVEQINANFRHNPSKDPKEIDLAADPDAPQRTMPGIYKIEGDLLIICLGAERPTQFIGGANRKASLLVFKR
jgi:uncharacterized protein (TIGR03067 family)